MDLCLSTIRSTGITDESPEKQQSPYTVLIHILDDDSLLNIFYLYRPYFSGEWGEWDQAGWWYRLTHVCQRWRNLILGSASYLRLSLVCTNGIPVANMLAHSPPLPLTIYYTDGGDVTAEDEEGILLALQQRDRLRNLRFYLSIQDLQKFIMAIDGEFPILENLSVEPSTRSTTVLTTPESLQAPHLRHLMLEGFAYPIRSRFHPTAASLVTLSLRIHHQSAYFQPNVLLQWISFLPQLKDLDIAFSFPIPNRDVERQLIHAPVTTHIILPYLRSFWFRGVSAYLEALVSRITTPRLKVVEIQLSKQLTFSIPHLLQFMITTENLRFDSARIHFFNERTYVETSIHETHAVSLTIMVYCWQLDWQVSSAAQILNALIEVFSTVEDLALCHEVHHKSSEEHNNVDRTDWRNLLRPFSNVKTLRIEDGIVEEISRCLQLEDGELPLELLPELQELTYFGSGDAGDAFTSFIDARENAGRIVTLGRRSPSPSLSSLESSAITLSSDEAANDIET